MNSITYSITFISEELEEMVVTAIVSDGRACGAYECSQAFTLGRGFTAEDAIVAFIGYLAHTGKTLHAREYEGV